MVMLILVCKVFHGENGSHPTGPETSVLFRVVLKREDRDVVPCTLSPAVLYHYKIDLYDMNSTMYHKPKK